MTKKLASIVFGAVVLASCASGSHEAALPAAVPNGLHSNVSPTSPLHVLYRFKNYTDGAGPSGPLVALNGTLWGTTQAGGSPYSGSQYGTVFSYDLKTGKERIVHSFKGGADGSDPTGGLIAVDGILYGTTASDNDGGTVFALNPKTGLESVLHTFAGADGIYPQSGLVAANGLLYGTASRGGIANSTTCYGGCGTLFSIDPKTGSFHVIHSFAGSPDGSFPLAPPTAVNGTLYGTTAGGGGNTLGCACGTVYAFDLATGNERIVYTFGGGIDGQDPRAALTFARGRLYGTTPAGGFGDCTYGAPCGTVFSVQLASGEERVVYRFGRNPDGSDPEAPLIVADGLLYGTTRIGGTSNHGMVFSIDMTTRQERLVVSFPGILNQSKAPHGASPAAPLVRADGTFYGTTEFGGKYRSGDSFGSGTLFSLKLP